MVAAHEDAAADDTLRAQALHVLHSLGARTVAELARAFGCPAAVLPRQLAVLRRRGEAVPSRQGAHVYWRAATPQGPAPAMAAPPDAVARRWLRPSMRPFKRARRCYGHLAGELGVLQLQALHDRGLLAGPWWPDRAWTGPSAATTWAAGWGARCWRCTCA